jgi:hypothetical protein
MKAEVGAYERGYNLIARFTDWQGGYRPAIKWAERAQTWDRREWERRGAFGGISRRKVRP